MFAREFDLSRRQCEGLHKLLRELNVEEIPTSRSAFSSIVKEMGSKSVW